MADAQARLGPWRLVIGLGLVSLAADMVADGGKSLFGPLLGALGASALVVGLVTGAAEAVSLLLRLASGPLADRLGNHWGWTIAGYGLTAVCIPLLAVAPFVGTAGLAVASALILLERAGKALRSPSKTALLAHAAGAVGRGKGFGVHKTLDLVGAFSGPLLVAAVLGATGQLWLAYLVLAVPGVATLLLLFALRARVPDASVYDATPDDVLAEPASAKPAPAQPGSPEPAPTPQPGSPEPASDPRRAPGAWARSLGAGLPREFFAYAGAVGLTTGGLVSYGVISFHLVRDGLLALPLVPVAFAGAMAVAAVAALVSGWVYDRQGGAVLIVLPLLVALVAPLALGGNVGLILVGVACWGAANGVQDSTIKALVADLVPSARRATAYGVFAAVQGLAALVGGVVVGALFDTSLPLLVAVVAAAQVVAAFLLVRVLRK